MNRFKGYTALVVDDSSTMRRLMDITLGHLGLEIEFADCGNDALKLIKDRLYSIIFLDIMLPDIDGYRVCKGIKGDKRARHTPVIMLSALDELDSVVRCIEMGAEDYLIKPVNEILLKARIDASLEKKRLRDEQRALFRKFTSDEVAEELLNTGFSLGGRLVELADTATFFTSPADPRTTAFVRGEMVY